MLTELDYIKKHVFDFKEIKLNEKIIPSFVLEKLNEKIIPIKTDFSKFINTDFFIVLNEDFQVLKNYKWRTKKDPQKELLCVKIDFTDEGKQVKKLTTIKKTDITCWNLFWRFFGYGKLVGLDYTLSGVAEHVVGVLKDKQTQKFVRIPADSPEVENIQKIYDRSKASATKDTLKEFLDFVSQPAVEEKEEVGPVLEPVVEEIELQEKAP